MKIIITAFLASLISTESIALECNALLDHGLRNIRISQGSSAATKFLYTNHCYKQFDQMSDSQLAEAEAEVFGYGGGSAGYTRDKREERLVDWCKTSKEEAESSAAKHNESRLIYDKALQAYTSCNKLAANSIRASVQIAADQSRANFNLRYVGGAISGVQFLGVNHQQNFTCSTTGPRIDGEGVIEYSKELLENQNIFIKSQAIVVNCTRSAKTETREVDGNKYDVLPEATIGVDTAQESFLIDFPEVWPSPGAPVAQYSLLKNELLEKIATEKAELQSSINDIHKSLQSTNAAVANNRNKVQTNEQNFSNLDVFVKIGPWNGTCGSPNHPVSCPAGYTVKGEGSVFVRSGGAHGFCDKVWLCVRK